METIAFVWRLLSFILLWLAFFCLLAAGILAITKRVRSASETQEPSLPSLPLGVFLRLSLIFASTGVLILLLSSPGGAGSAEGRWEIILLEAACAILIIWNVKALIEIERSQAGGKR